VFFIIQIKDIMEKSKSLMENWINPLINAKKKDAVDDVRSRSANLF